MTWKKNITFDLDDTLYPERDFVRSGFNTVANYLDEMNIVSQDIFFNKAWQLFNNGVRNTIFNQIFEILEIDINNDRILELREVYRSHFPIIQAHKRAAYLLEALHIKGACLGLISDGPPQTQRNKLLALGLEKYFNEIIFTGDYGPEWNKPSPLAFLEIMKRIRVSPANCVYVADNPKKDFLGPNKLGWRTIRLRCKSGLYYSELPPAGGAPHITIDDFDELYNLLLTG